MKLNSDPLWFYLKLSIPWPTHTHQPDIGCVVELLQLQFPPKHLPCQIFMEIKMGMTVLITCPAHDSCSSNGTSLLIMTNGPSLCQAGLHPLPWRWLHTSPYFAHAFQYTQMLSPILLVHPYYLAQTPSLTKCFQSVHARKKKLTDRSGLCLVLFYMADTI